MSGFLIHTYVAHHCNVYLCCDEYYCQVIKTPLLFESIATYQGALAQTTLQLQLPWDNPAAATMHVAETRPTFVVSPLDRG